MRTQENNYAFIDSQNLNLGIRAQDWKLDFARFRVYLKDKYRVTKAFLIKADEITLVGRGEEIKL